MSSTIIGLITQFEHQYSISTAEITSKIGQLPQVAPTAVMPAVNEIRRMLIGVQELLEQMEMSVREIDSSSPDRSKYDLRVKSFRSDKRQLDEELKKAVDRLKSISDRMELFDESANVDQQDRLISNTERLERTSRKIDDSYRITVESEGIGADVLENLSQQRDTLNRARERMREADTNLSRSNKIISQMTRRILQNRLILIIVAVLMMFSLLLLVYKTV